MTDDRHAMWSDCPRHHVEHTIETGVNLVSVRVIACAIFWFDQPKAFITSQIHDDVPRDAKHARD
ncbi:MAG: hypothetical protein AAFN94_12380, partial [Pseudomonadota bacterium]